MSTIDASGTRVDLTHLLDDAERGEEITLTRDGKPVAMLVRPDRVRPHPPGQVVKEADRIEAIL